MSTKGYVLGQCEATAKNGKRCQKGGAGRVDGRLLCGNHQPDRQRKPDRGGDRDPSPAEAGAFLRYTLEEAYLCARVGIMLEAGIDPVEFASLTPEERRAHVRRLASFTVKAIKRPCLAAAAAGRHFFDKKHERHPDLQARQIVWELYRNARGASLPARWWDELDNALSFNREPVPADDASADCRWPETKPSTH